LPFDCQVRRRLGAEACNRECPASSPVFEVHAVGHAGEEPPADARRIDIALLDMHHGWPNLGHDSIVQAIQNAVCDLSAELSARRIGVRVLSYDVRRGLAIPEPPGSRFTLYVGTGGPAHVDPRENDGARPGSQGIVEDPSWEAPLIRLFDRILESPDASLLGVCHTFGVMCRWLGVADASLRGPEKGGKSTGIVENVLTDAAVRHPWFARFADALPDGRRFPVLDNRLYDLIPRSPWPKGVTALAFETLGVGGPQGDGVTMIEAARDRDGRMPRILGVNHHPEVVHRPRQLLVLQRKFERGDVTRAWYEERLRALTEPVADHRGDSLLHLTASYLFLAPLRLYLFRLARARAQALGVPLHMDEAELPLTYPRRQP
jgi:hypothetical protein